MDERLKYKFETIKLLGNKLLDIGLSNFFLDLTPKARENKSKNKQMAIICVCVDTHTVKYYLATPTHKILPYTATWIDLKGIIICEISQGKTNTV